MNYFLVALGGMIGSVARYSVSSVSIHSFPNLKFPLGTFIVNAVGCLCIGLAAGFLERYTTLNAELRVFVITGILGGFTTFSAFSAETLYLIRSDEVFLGVSYALLSVIIGVLLVFVGFRCAG